MRPIDRYARMQGARWGNQDVSHVAPMSPGAWVPLIIKLQIIRKSHVGKSEGIVVAVRSRKGV